MKRLAVTSESLIDARHAAPVRKRGNRESRIPEIIEVSINVLVSAGYAGYTINSVAIEAGIRLSTLQHYFSSREELLRCTVEEISRRYLERFQHFAEDKSCSPRDRLEAILDDALAELGKPGMPVAIFECWGLALHEQFAHDLVVQLRNQYKEMFANLVGEINPALSTEERALRGALLLCSFEGLVAYLRWNDDDAMRQAAFRKAVKVVWHGLSEASE